MKDHLTILLLGKGSRESALAWKILQSPRCKRLLTAPLCVEGAECIKGLDPLDFPAVAKIVEENGVDMVVVGPELPIVEGIADFLAPLCKVIAPCREAARLEGSKEFAKEFMFDNAIPTARFMSVTHDTLDDGYAFLESLKGPYVLKADGLASGKGVIIVDTLEEARQTLQKMLDGMFGDASVTVVIEEFLDGRECSVFVATDGEDYILLPVARDYKRQGVGDTGLNTGGMGAVSPVSYVDEIFLDKVRRRIVEPTLRGLRDAGISYRGFIFLGLIKVDGEPMVIEYNVRLGDPETSVVMARIESDFVDLLEGIADSTLALKRLRVSPESAVGVVVASEGYPSHPVTGRHIEGLMPGPDGAMHSDGEGVAPNVVFPGGISFLEGSMITSGGRVATAVAMAPDTDEAARRALGAAGAIRFEGAFFRSDIGINA